MLIPRQIVTRHRSIDSEPMLSAIRRGLVACRQFLLSLEAAGLRAIIFAIVQTASYLLALNLTHRILFRERQLYATNLPATGRASQHYNLLGILTVQLGGVRGEGESGRGGHGETGRRGENKELRLQPDSIL